MTKINTVPFVISLLFYNVKERIQNVHNRSPPLPLSLYLSIYIYISLSLSLSHSSQNNAVKTLNKGHNRDNMFYQSITILEFWDTEHSVLCREVYYTVSLSQRVHIQYYLQYSSSIVTYYSNEAIIYSENFTLKGTQF